MGSAWTRQYGAGCGPGRRPGARRVDTGVESPGVGLLFGAGGGRADGV